MQAANSGRFDHGGNDVVFSTILVQKEEIEIRNENTAMQFAPSVFGLLLLVACAPSPEPVAQPLPPVDYALKQQEPDSCGKAEYATLIGQPEGMLRTVALTRRYRVIPMGGIVTQDYDASRINFNLDADGKIASINCG